MARRRKKGLPVHGWLILDKPLGMTSTQAVGKIRWLFNAQKAGHAGTLDPLATGVLPIALGEATKTVPYAVDDVKAYEFTVRWGVETDTDDADGQAVETSDARPAADAIEAILGDFTGEILQRPPRFSAIKVDGARAYDLAREGEAVELDARPIHVDALTLVERRDPDTAVFEAVCGKGTYVRALARDMGRVLGCLGHVTALRRTQVGGFTVDDCHTLEALIEAGEWRDDEGQQQRVEGEARVALLGHLLPPETALDNLCALHVNANDAGRIGRGQSVLMRGRDAPITHGEAFAVFKDKLLALGVIEKGVFKPTRVMNL
ncbi:MAG: tRNA pseudouridine(55) synthase TruB [Pseudomonadota bacterium]